jgi:pyruvate dehydrogenase E1 component alpha subunit
MDVSAVAEAAAQAAEYVRAGKGPAFLECSSIRLRSHSTTARETRSREELAALNELCPISREAARLRADGRLDEAGLENLRREALQRAQDIMAFADASPYPEPSEALAHVG